MQICSENYKIRDHLGVEVMMCEDFNSCQLSKKFQLLRNQKFYFRVYKLLRLEPAIS
jgi:hypothetical protein